MTDSPKPAISLGNLPLETWSKGARFGGADARVSTILGLTRLGCSYSEVPPGKSGCPFHVHHAEDEMFVILEGMGEYRFGEERHVVKAGDVLGAPIGGADKAHQLFNTGDAPLRYLGISSVADIDICEYPDSGKIGYFGRHAGGGERFRLIARNGNKVDYWDGEDIGEAE